MKSNASSGIDDITAPAKVKPSATARPIVVKEHSLASDPMLSEQTTEPAPEKPVVINRTAKTITPLSSAEPEQDPEPVAAEPAATDETESQPEPSIEDAPAPEPKPEDRPAPEESPEEVPEPANEPVPQDQAAQDAALAEQEAAEAARQAELEKLIEAGTYAVPIDAVRRKRSHMFLAFMTLLIIILAVLLLDVIADAGLVKLPSSVPHTHFFSGK